MEHNERFDAQFLHILNRNGLSLVGAKQLIEEQMLTDAKDRHRLYEVLREFIAPGPNPPPRKAIRDLKKGR